MVEASPRKNSAEVHCYSGHTYAERPLSFVWRSNRYEVAEIEEAWQEPGARHFRVRAMGNKRFKLWYNEFQDKWSITEITGS